MSSTIAAPFSVHFERIDAERATELLLTNIEGNRHLSLSRVERYVEDILGGFWVPTHQGIAIDSTGKLFDGQHRLEAIIQADKRQPGSAVDMMVCSNLDPAVFWLTDGGLARNAQSFLEGPYRSQRTALARTIMQIEENNGTASLNTVIGGNYPSHRILHYIENNPMMRDYGLAYSRNADRASRSGMFTGTSTAGLLIGGYIAGIKDNDLWTDWWEDVEAVIQRNGLEDGNPIKALSKAAPVGGNFTRYAYIRAVYTGVKYQKRQSLKVIQSKTIGEVKVW